MHWMGTPMPGELAVMIAVEAPHRKEAFLAREHVIKRLKQNVSI
jgi:molybdopterin synthase catalytic subunit